MIFWSAKAVTDMGSLLLGDANIIRVILCPADNGRHEKGRTENDAP
jgi:hypothetical protein